MAAEFPPGVREQIQKIKNDDRMELNLKIDCIRDVLMSHSITYFVDEKTDVFLVHPANPEGVYVEPL